jgi:4-hydroxy-3-polyprenylbenzoate decarboxylase
LTEPHGGPHPFIPGSPKFSPIQSSQQTNALLHLHRRSPFGDGDFSALGKGVSPAGVAADSINPTNDEAETNSLFVPSEAEVIIEGEVSPNETAAEGPYPEFWFYREAQPAPVFHVKTITHRTDPIIPFSVDGVKPSDTHNLISLMISFEIYNRLINIRNFPVKWVQMPLEFNLNFVIICGKPIFPGFVAWSSKYVLSQSRQFGSLYNKVVFVDDKTTSLHLEEPILFMIRTHPNRGTIS